MDLDAARPVPPGRRWVNASYVLAWLSIIFYPVLLGPLAMLLAVVGARHGEVRRGRRAAIVAACCMVAGFVLYAVLLPLALRDGSQAAALPVVGSPVVG